MCAVPSSSGVDSNVHFSPLVKHFNHYDDGHLIRGECGSYSSEHNIIKFCWTDKRERVTKALKPQAAIPAIPHLLEFSCFSKFPPSFCNLKAYIMKYCCSKDQHLPSEMMSSQWKYPKSRVLPKIRSFIPGYGVNAGEKVLGIFSNKYFLPRSQNFSFQN